MEQQQTNPRKPVVLAVLIFVFAAAIFGAAFYLFDGMELVDDFMASDPIGTESGDPVASDDPVVEENPDDGEISVIATDTLQLPPGMTEDFALRLWQEQIDSQANIQKLVDGEVTRFDLGKPVVVADSVEIPLKVTFTDQVSVDGLLVMNRVEDYWYTAYISRTDVTDESTGSVAPPTPLPDIKDVDIEVLNTLLAQQRASRDVLSEYADGVVSSVEIVSVTQGAGTRTLEIKMTENHEIGIGQIVCLMREVDGEPLWFVARFTKL